MEIYLIRHGKMTGDPHQHYDPPVEGCLSELGLRQAEALTASLDRIAFDAIYTSPLGRAIQTIQATAQRQGVAIETMEWLIEWRPAPALKEGDEAQFEAMMERVASLHPEECWKTPAGEGTCQMADRIIPGFLEVLGRHGVRAGHGGYLFQDPENSTRIALVAHGGSLGLLASFILGVPLKPFTPISFKETGVAVIGFTQRADVWHPVLNIPPPYEPIQEEK